MKVLVGLAVGVRIFNGARGLQHGVGFASTSDQSSPVKADWSIRR